MTRIQLNKKNLIIFVVVYSVLACVSRYMFVTSTVGSLPFWPAAGFLFAFFLTTEAKSWPILIGAAWLSWLINNYFFGLMNWSIFYVLPWSTLTQIIGVLIYRRYTVKKDSDYDRVFAMLIIGGLLVPGLMASSSFITDWLSPSSILNVVKWRLRFVGASLGILTITPVTLALIDKLNQKKIKLAIQKVDIISLFFVFLATYLVFAGNSTKANSHHPFFLVPFFAWIAFQGKPGLTAVANLLVSFIVITQTFLGQGPFANAYADPVAAVTALQVFVGIFTLTQMILTAAIAGRKKLAADLLARGQELERLNDELKIAKQAAFDSRDAKTQFLADMSHEIRSPLAAMKGFAEMLLDEDNLSLIEKRRSIEIIKDSAVHLNELVNQVLDLSKIEAGRFELDARPTDLRELFESIINLMQLKASEKDLRINLTFSSKVPKLFCTDPIRLRQIVLNTLSNAIKFTLKGKISVHVYASELASGQYRLECEIEDTGIGLSASEQLRLFQSYTQANSTIASVYGGTGLGLLLSRRLSNCLGGDFSLLRSEKGVGSVFHFYVEEIKLDLHASLPEPKSKKMNFNLDSLPAEILSGMKILFADDSIENHFLVNLSLKATGASLDCVSNGAIAVEQAICGNYDIILMDLEMPIMTGIEAVSALRKKHYDRPIIALSAHTMSDENEFCQRRGFNRYLRKPIQRAALIQLLLDFKKPSLTYHSADLSVL